MTFEEWLETRPYVDIDDFLRDAWESGIQEGTDRMYRLYDICPQCKLTNGQHKMDCGRGR
jgi:hypothetical protein